MIELRWIETQIGIDAQGFGLYERILQYRVDISAGQGVWYVKKDDRMSQWADVPTVRQSGDEGKE